MAKRPKISDELHDVVHQIHEEYTGSSAAGFEPALNTVTQLAEANILEREGTEPGWYPGKYLTEVTERLSSSRSENQSNSNSSEESSTESIGVTVDPDSQAVFKAILGDEETISIPEAELAALDLTEGELVQVIAYPVDNE